MIDKILGSYSLKYTLNHSADIEPIKLASIPNYYYLALGITNVCNFDCPFCYYHRNGIQKACSHLPIETAKKIFGALPPLAGVIFGLEGEPLLHDRFLDFMKLAQNYTKEICLITNGSLLTEKLCDELEVFPVNRIILSIDGSDATAYEQFRKNGIFKQFKKNAFMAAKRFTCQLHATVFRENLDSLLNLPALSRELGIECISFQQLRIRPNSDIKNIHPASSFEIRNWITNLLANATKHGVSVEFDRNFGGSGLISTLMHIAQSGSSVTIAPLETGHCEHADKLACILSDGNLFPCAGDFEPVQLSEYSFDAIYNHPYLQALRSLHKAGRKIEPCLICMNDLLTC